MWVLFSAFFGCGLALAEVGAVVGPSWWWALWVLPPALPGRDPSLVAGEMGCWTVPSGSFFLRAIGGCGGWSFCLFRSGSSCVMLPDVVDWGFSSTVMGWVASCPSRLWSPWLPPPFFACPGFTVGVGWVAPFPCRQPLLCPRPRGWWLPLFVAGAGVGLSRVVFLLARRRPRGRCGLPSLGGVVSRFPSGGP